MARYYSGDPYWTTARYNSTCKHCGATIRKGDQIFYYPKGKAVYCQHEDCGGIESARFQEYVMDEMLMSGECY